MGCGKSTTGKKLALILGWQFVDLDKEIERKAGQAIKDIFSSSGEDYFRKLEAETLFSLITSADTVISTGGGTPCYGSNMDFMNRTGQVIYLKMTPGQLMSRLKGGEDSRPLITNLNKPDLLQYVSDKLAEREVHYLRASIIINGFDLDIRALSETIKATLKF